VFKTLVLYKQKQECLSVKGKPSASTDTLFAPVTLIYEFDLDILTMFLHTKHDLFRSRLSKVRALQTDGCECDRTHYIMLHSRLVSKKNRPSKMLVQD